jgi:hypothetical protein
MSVLFAGGEDIDFDPFAWTGTDGGMRRTSYSRLSLYVNYQNAYTRYRSTLFNGGAVKDLWFSCRVRWATPTTSKYFIWLGQSGNAYGYGIGMAAASSTRLALYKAASSITELQAETGNSIDSTKVVLLTVHIENYDGDGDCNITVYQDGEEKIAWSGDAAISGLTGFDEVQLYTNTDNYACYFSEFIVSTEDNRYYSLCSLYPNADSGTDDWEGSRADIEETVCSDTTLIYTDTADEDFQCGLANTPTLIGTAVAVVVTARASKSNDASIQTLKLGVSSDSTIDVDAGRALTTSWDTYMRIAPTINGGVLTKTQLDAMLLDLQSDT